MAGRQKDPVQTNATRITLLEKSYELFVEKTIEKVTMADITKACGLSNVTVYRYFKNKPQLVVETATWKWQQFRKENLTVALQGVIKDATAAQLFEFYLDSFIMLYEKHRDILRFNQFFNAYVKSENIDEHMLQPYKELIRDIKDQFHVMYTRAKEDLTVRVDESEEVMFSTTLHIMLAIVTRYAVGLVYIPNEDFDAKKELIVQKEMFLDRYVIRVEKGK